MKKRGENPLAREATPDPIAAPAAERRRHARLRQNSLLSNLGPVTDLSRSGLRILTTRRRRGVLRIILFGQSGRRLNLQARVVWSKRLAFRKHLVGLELVGSDENVARELGRMGTSGFFNGT